MGRGEAWDNEITFPPLVERETWDYDDAANIEGRTRDGSWDEFTYEGLNRLVAAGSIDYEYTRAGEVREKRSPDGTTTLSWNSRGELIEASTADGVTVRYGYDAFGRMVSRTATPADGEIPPTAERSAYLWHERTLLAEYDVSEGGEASPYKEYFHVAGRLIAVKMHGFHGRREPGPEGFLHTKGGVMYYHLDRLGSPVAITDRHGEPVARYAWDAYGRAMAGIFEPYNSVGFTGHLYDQATGLTYFGARWYDAETGKFLSRDPIQDGWNWYAYVGGDPVNFVDMWGLEREPEALAVPGNGKPPEPDFTGVSVDSRYIETYAGIGLGVATSTATEYQGGVPVETKRLFEVSAIVETDIGIDFGRRVSNYPGATMHDMYGASISGSATFGAPITVTPQVTLSGTRTSTGRSSQLTANSSGGSSLLPVSVSASLTYTVDNPGFRAAGEAASRVRYSGGSYTRNARTLR